MATLYWIHHPKHTDMFADGYIGVSNNFDKRLKYHKNSCSNKHLENAINLYGWENLVKKIIIEADIKYCLDIEKKLRPKDQIGWNLVKGGGIPPVNFGNKARANKTPWNKGIPMSDELKDKISKSKKGLKAWNSGTKGIMKAWNKGLSTPDEVKAKQSIAKLGKPSPKKGKTYKSQKESE